MNGLVAILQLLVAWNCGMSRASYIALATNYNILIVLII
jgi:hypothetical protein